MARLNRVELIGNLGKNGELRYLANGQPKIEFTMAVDDSYKKGNDWVNQSQWFNVVLWGDQAERMAQQLTKGTPVFVEGKLTTRSWDDDQGQKHYRTEIVARTIAVLVRPPKRDDQNFQRAEDPDDEDLPFV